MLVIEQTKGQTLDSWAKINWSAVERIVERLQARIYRAAEQGHHAKVKNLQKLLARSTSTKLLAIRRVTQENKGRHTPGIDGKVCKTPEDRLELLKDGLSLNGYRPKPVRRVYIPKSNGKQRPLGIPTIKDRVMQCIIKSALEPEWESRFEANSYGFRPGRNTMDALTAIHTTLNQKDARKWILDADIGGCFDNIDHDRLLKRIPVFTRTIRRWLKAGVAEFGTYKDTHTGTPQGGIISPLLANIALDGMERLFGCETAKGKPIPPGKRYGRNLGINLIRYADDFVVTAPSKEVLETYVKPRLVEFLAERGLKLNDAKTRIVHVDEGFNFLGFTIRSYNGKLLTKPQKEKVQAHLRRIKNYLRRNQQTPAWRVVKDLNPITRGWANYYRHGASKVTFEKVDHKVWQKLWPWAKRRHPNKTSKWVRKRYFTQDGYWRLHEGNATMIRHSDTAVTRYVKISGKATPMNPTQKDYWEKRRRRNVARAMGSRQRLELLRRQNNKCARCGRDFLPGEGIDHIDDHHVQPRSRGGTNKLENRELAHRWCHHAYHGRKGYK